MKNARIQIKQTHTAKGVEAALVHDSMFLGATPTPFLYFDPISGETIRAATAPRNGTAIDLVAAIKAAGGLMSRAWLKRQQKIAGWGGRELKQLSPSEDREDWFELTVQFDAEGHTEPTRAWLAILDALASPDHLAGVSYSENTTGPAGAIKGRRAVVAGGASLHCTEDHSVVSSPYGLTCKKRSVFRFRVFVHAYAIGLDSGRFAVSDRGWFSWNAAAQQEEALDRAIQGALAAQERDEIAAAMKAAQEPANMDLPSLWAATTCPEAPTLAGTAKTIPARSARRI